MFNVTVNNDQLKQASRSGETVIGVKNDEGSTNEI